MSIGSFTSAVQGGPGPTPASAVTTARGQVARSPSSSSEPLFVVMPGFSLAFPYEVPSGQWAAEGLPAVGAECLICFDDKGDAWVPLWQGMTAGGGGGDGGTGPQGPQGPTGSRARRARKDRGRRDEAVAQGRRLDGQRRPAGAARRDGTARADRGGRRQGIRRLGLRRDNPDRRERP